MELLLLRHAEAVPGHPDEERALSPAGRQQCARLGQHIRRGAWPLPDLLWCSPLRRAAETATEVCAAAGWLGLREEVHAHLVPEGDPSETLAALRQASAERLLVVGHNPHLSALAQVLVGSPRPLLDLDKAGLLIFHTSDRGPLMRTRWWLSGYLTPFLTARY